MKRVSVILFASVFIGVVVDLFAQNPIERVWQEIDSSAVETIYRKQQPVMISPWSTSIVVGTSFLFAPGYGSAMNHFVAPHASYAATNRLSLHGGVIASRTTPISYAANNEFLLSSGLSNLSLFVAGSYRLTEKLILHGTGVKYITGMPNDMINPNLNFQDISLGATYHLGNFSVGATIHKSNNSYQNPPFGYQNRMFGSPMLW